MNKHQVWFKTIGSFGTDFHLHLIRIPVNLTQTIKLPSKALDTIKTKLSLMHYRSDPRHQRMNAHAGNKVAQLKLDGSYFLLKTSETQLLLIKNNLESVNSTLPMRDRVKIGGYRIIDL
jgi:hypothetical protein